LLFWWRRRARGGGRRSGARSKAAGGWRRRPTRRRQRPGAAPGVGGSTRDVEKGVDIAFDVDVRVLDGVAGPGLGGQVYQVVGALGVEDQPQCLALGQVKAVKGEVAGADSRLLAFFAAPARRHRPAPAGAGGRTSGRYRSSRDAVHADHPVTPGQQAGAEMEADEAGGAGHQHVAFFRFHVFLIITARLPPLIKAAAPIKERGNTGWIILHLPPEGNSRPASGCWVTICRLGQRPDLAGM